MLCHMPGTVFLSCGQNDRELQIADKVRKLLEGPSFGLKVFVARMRSATGSCWSFPK
jgi:hypothetical protein